MKLGCLANGSSIDTLWWVNDLAAIGRDVRMITAHDSDLAINKLGETQSLPLRASHGYLLSSPFEVVFTLVNDNDLSEQMGRNGRKLVCARFDGQHCVHLMEQAYENTLKSATMSG